MFKSCCICVSKKIEIDNQSPSKGDSAEKKSNDKLQVIHTEVFLANDISNGSQDLKTVSEAEAVTTSVRGEELETVPEESHTNSLTTEMESSKAEETGAKSNGDDNTITESSTSSKIKFGGSVIIEDGATVQDTDDESESDEDSENFIDKLTEAKDTSDPYASTTNAEENRDERSGSESVSDQVFENPNPVPMRRKSSTGGILKRPSVVDKFACEEVSQNFSSLKLDDDVFPPGIEGQRWMARKRSLPAGVLGVALGRDELALKRHRIFSELVGAAKAAVEHKVRFDPLELAVEPARKKEPVQKFDNPAELEKLVERLESAVSRLEKVAGCFQAPSSPLVTSAPESTASESLTNSPLCQTSPPFTMSLAAYQDIVTGPLERFMQCSAGLQHVQEQAALVKKLFNTQLEYLTMASRSSAPTNQNDAIAQLKGHTEGIEGIQKLREANKTSPNFTFLSAISESIPALGWVCVKPTPAPYIKEMNDVGKYYTNRILKESKGNQQLTNWCVAWTETLGSLEAFVKQYHTTGLVWGGAAAAGGCPPPPPPCPPPCMPPPPDMSDDADDRSALFAQINQGEDITKSLKKVTSDMQTHKNPTLREGPAPFKTPVGAPKPFAKNLPTPGAGQAPTKPPVFSRDGKKWLIEYQMGNNALVVENAEMNNVVYMFRCRDSVLNIKGKINSVVLDSCTKCSVVFESLVSSVEFVNCQSVQMQVLGKVPTISIDKTDGCQMYLSNDSMDVEIVSSKSSEMNVMIPKGNGDYTELAVAEQFKTTVNKGNKSLNTVAVENKG